MKIKGIIPAVVTPFAEDEKLNEDGLVYVIEHLVNSGVHGVFTVGSTGEFWALTNEEKKRIYRITVDCVNKKVPVYVGTGTNTTKETVGLSQYAQKAGADFVSVITPMFINPNDNELFQHYKTIAASVDIPLILYTNPARTGVHLSTSLVNRLAKECKNIVGIKDSIGDLRQTMEYIRECPEDFSVIAGNDSLILATLMHGGVGAIAASANVVPELVVRIYDCFKAGKYQEAANAQNKLAIFRKAFTLGSFPVVLKEGAEMVGLPAGPARKPIRGMSDENRNKLKEILENIDI